MKLYQEIGNSFPKKVDLENQKHLHFMFLDFKLKNPDKTKTYEFEKISYKEGVSIIIASQKLELAIMLAKNEYNICINEKKEICDLIKIENPDLFTFKEIV